MTSTSIVRYEELKKFLAEYNITHAAIANQLGLRQQGIHSLLRGETMPTVHHVKLIALGFPENLLPTPLDKSRGRQAKVPCWPAFSNLRNVSNTNNTQIISQK